MRPFVDPNDRYSYEDWMNEMGADENMSKSTQQMMDDMLGDLAPLPWNIAAAPDDDCIVDANNMLVATVNRDHPAAEQCMTALLCAVNTLGGYKADAA